MMTRREVFIRESAFACALGNEGGEAASALRADRCGPAEKIFRFGQLQTARRYYALPQAVAENSFYDKLESILERLIARSALRKDELEGCALYMGSTSMNLTCWEGAFREHPKETQMPKMDGYGEIGRKLAEKFGIGGEVLLFSTACTSSANALLEASREIRSSRMERAIVVGFEFYNELTICGFEAMGLLSKGECKPFDLNRSGMVLGEGCGAILLDSASLQNGASLKLSGGSNRSDVHSITSHNEDGSVIAHTIRDAMHDAGVDVGMITHIKGHATGSTHNDLAEGRGIRSVFAHPPEIFVLKSALGHTLGACGALELAIMHETLKEGFVPRTLGFDTVDPEMEIVPTDTASEVSEGCFLLNHFGFAGSGVALVVQYTQGNVS